MKLVRPHVSVSPTLSSRTAGFPDDHVRLVERHDAERHLMHMPYALYGASGVPLVEGESIRLVTMDAGFNDLPDAVWLRRNHPQARIAFRSNDRHAQAIACANGVGLAVLPCPLGDSHPGLTRMALPSAPPGRDVWVGYHRDLRRLPRRRALLDLLIERVGTSGSGAPS